MVCPACQVSISIERTAADLALTYDFEDWRVRCRCVERDDPALCENLRTAIQRLLAECKDTPLGVEDPREK
jgi:hypothetical protein